MCHIGTIQLYGQGGFADETKVIDFKIGPWIVLDHPYALSVVTKTSEREKGIEESLQQQRQRRYSKPITLKGRSWHC